MCMATKPIITLTYTRVYDIKSNPRGDGRDKGIAKCGFRWQATWSVLWASKVIVNGRKVGTKGHLSGALNECVRQGSTKVIEITATGYGQTVTRDFVIKGKGMCKC